MSIHLLGPPRLERGDGPVAVPRGHKAWGLLVYLRRTRVPPPRERLAELLFPNADDPLRALRWTLRDRFAAELAPLRPSAARSPQA